MPEAVFVVDAKDLAGLREKLATGEFALGPARKFVARSAMQMRVEIRARTPINLGHLHSSIAVAIEDEGLTGIVGSNLNYAPHVEFGTRPHYPPLAAIQAWVHSKGLAGRVSVKTKRRLGNKTAIASEDMALARAIQRKIGARGTKGHFMFQRGLAAAQPFIDTEARLALEEMGQNWQS